MDRWWNDWPSGPAAADPHEFLAVVRKTIEGTLFVVRATPLHLKARRDRLLSLFAVHFLGRRPNQIQSIAGGPNLNGVWPPCNGNTFETTECLFITLLRSVPAKYYGAQDI